ncbi:MAG: hypothetical protein M3O01_12930 [Pseudomonadota bacterium]|nr:hypothetical protein [Pseudomonadota bacterium]
MKYLVPSALCIAATAHATDYPLQYLDAPPQSFSVQGPFADNVDFTVTADGVYTITLVPMNYVVAGAGRYSQSPGRIVTTITSAQVRNAAGTTAIADVVYSAQVQLTAGTYALHIVGAGQGTKKYLGVGSYSVAVTSPPHALQCEWYDERNIPRDPGCTGP